MIHANCFRQTFNKETWEQSTSELEMMQTLSFSNKSRSFLIAVIRSSSAEVSQWVSQSVEVEISRTFLILFREMLLSSSWYRGAKKNISQSPVGAPPGQIPAGPVSVFNCYYKIFGTEQTARRGDTLVPRLNRHRLTDPVRSRDLHGRDIEIERIERNIQYYVTKWCKCENFVVIFWCRLHHISSNGKLS